jgi:hypothetical protein
MEFEKAIHSTIGVQFRCVPDDGKLRRFKIGARDEGFAIRFPDCGAFGNWSKDIYYQWDGNKVRPVPKSEKMRRLNAKEFRDEQAIIAIGNAASDSGKPLQGEDLDRYILALTRVIDEKAKAVGARG